MPAFPKWEQPEDFEVYCIEDPRGEEKGCPEEVKLRITPEEVSVLDNGKLFESYNLDAIESHKAEDAGGEDLPTLALTIEGIGEVVFESENAVAASKSLESALQYYLDQEAKEDNTDKQKVQNKPEGPWQSRLKEAFNEFDSDGSGVISKGGFDAMMKSFLQVEPSSEQIESILAALGCENSDSVSFGDLLKVGASGDLDHLGWNAEFSVTALSDLPSVDWRPMSCYPVEDPTGSLTDEIGLVICESGVMLVKDDSKGVLLRWHWKHINHFEKEKQSEDPEDMDLFVVNVSVSGDAKEFVFECEDGDFLYKTLLVAQTKALGTKPVDHATTGKQTDAADGDNGDTEADGENDNAVTGAEIGAEIDAEAEDGAEPETKKTSTPPERKKSTKNAAQAIPQRKKSTKKGASAIPVRKGSKKTPTADGVPAKKGKKKGGKKGGKKKSVSKKAAGAKKKADKKKEDDKEEDKGVDKEKGEDKKTKEGAEEKKGGDDDDDDEDGSGGEEGKEGVVEAQKGVKFNKFGEMIRKKKAVEMTEEQLKALKEQQEAFQLDEKKVKEAKASMKDSERKKLLQYTLKVPEALIGYRLIVIFSELGLTGTGVVRGCTHSFLKGTSWVIEFEDGEQEAYPLDIIGSKKKGKIPFRIVKKEPVTEKAVRTALDEEENAEQNPLAEEVLGFNWQEVCDHRPTADEQAKGQVIRSCTTDDQALLNWHVEVLGMGRCTLIELKAHTDSQAQYVCKMDDPKLKPVQLTLDLKGVGGEGKEQFFLLDKKVEDEPEFSDEENEDDEGDEDGEDF